MPPMFESDEVSSNGDITLTESQAVLRYVTNGNTSWFAADREAFVTVLECTIDKLVGDLDSFQACNEFGEFRDLPPHVQRAILDMVTAKIPVYPGHLRKIEEVCDGVTHCIRQRLLRRYPHDSHADASPDA